MRVGRLFIVTQLLLVYDQSLLAAENPLGDGPGHSLADDGACVPEVLPAAELEGVLTVLTIAMPREPVFGAADSQELAAKAPAGGDDARQEGVLEGGISGPSSDPLQDFFSRVFFCIYSTRAYCLVLT